MLSNKSLTVRLLPALAVSALVATSCSEIEPTEPTVPTDGESITQAAQTTGRYIVAFEPGSASAGRAAVEAAGQVALDIRGVDAVAAYLPDTAVAGLEGNPNVAYVEVDPPRELSTDLSANETSPWGIAAVQADQLGSGTGDITVCIIDSGYDLAHPDLPDEASGILTGVTHDKTQDMPWDEDGCGHGTHVAGTIAALGGNGQGVVGVNPTENVNLHIERVFGDGCGWAYASTLADAAVSCAENGANVISMSLGCAHPSNKLCYSRTEDTVFGQLYDGSLELSDGTLVSENQGGLLSLAAASNDGRDWYSYPASYDSVISIAAVDENLQRASFSNYNDKVELSAPGVGVLSTVPSSMACELCDGEEMYEYWNGTSMATPHAAGVAALVWSHFPDEANTAIRDALTTSALQLGSTDRDVEYGYGMVQAFDAYIAAGGTPLCAGDQDQDTYDDELTCDAGTDCDDSDPSVHPNANEVCDDVDHDCDGDPYNGYDDVGTECKAGTGECKSTGSWVCNANGDGTECDAVPGEPTIEICDELDNDCDGDVDEDCITCTDSDGDGYYTDSACGTAVDCDDSDPTVNPGATEVCGDEVDNDCDGAEDETDPDSEAGGCVDQCTEVGGACDLDSDCCSGKCRGKPGAKSCK